MPTNILINILGWMGSILYLLVVYTLSLGAYATTSLNGVWVAIGLFTLGRKWLTRS